MAKINVLDKKIYNRIAAGEVVERPFSVVKELIENCIDAGSTEINVQIENGGIDLIKISDNGCGIEKSEMEKALMPHATSKISQLKDLDSILTLGFRGEALASIASVSKLTITSKPKDQLNGSKIFCEGGTVCPVEDFPCQDGTTITVENLFFNTPARAKFLKPAKSEESDITNIVSRLILANPNIAFKLSSNGKVVLQSYGDGLKNAVISVYGTETINNCFEISTEKNGIKINGFIGKHHFTKPNRTYQTLILNGRYIVNATTSSAIQNAYGSYLMKRQYPFYVLNVEILPDFVDVNVHPNKTDVRFVNNQVVYGALYSVVSKVLDGSSQAIDIIVKGDFNAFPQETLSDNSFLDTNSDKKIASENLVFPEVANLKPTTPSIAPPKNVNYQSNYFPKDYKKDEKLSSALVFDSQYAPSSQEIKNDDIFAQNKAYIERLAKEAEEKKKVELQQKISVVNNLKFVGQILNSFLVAEKDDEVYFIDQHAAHERLIYDKFLNSYKQGNIAVQPLLVPYVSKLNPLEVENFSDKLPILKELGFDIAVDGFGNVSISAIPYDFSEMDFKVFFDDVVNDDNLLREKTPLIIKEKLIQKACKSAIKAGYVLDKTEIDELISKLNDNLGLKCPHGRPVACKITRTEIDKWFKRII